MKIGELAGRAGTNVETIRYYERIGLLPAPRRTEGNYRDYTEEQAKRLAFVRHARGLGFELADIRVLLDLSDQPERDCAEADRITSGHLRAVDARLPSYRACGPLSRQCFANARVGTYPTAESSKLCRITPAAARTTCQPPPPSGQSRDLWNLCRRGNRTGGMSNGAGLHSPHWHPKVRAGPACRIHPASSRAKRPQSQLGHA